MPSPSTSDPPGEELGERMTFADSLDELGSNGSGRELFVVEVGVEARRVGGDLGQDVGIDRYTAVRYPALSARMGHDRPTGRDLKIHDEVGQTRRRHRGGYDPQ